MAELLKGAPVAGAITEKIISEVAGLKARDITPTLALIRIGEDPGDLSYERGILKRCEKTGIVSKQIILPAEASKAEILDAVDNVNDDSDIHGVLLFRPLADKTAELEVAARLTPQKDVDAMTAASMAHVFTGAGVGFAPCTAEACIAILKHYGVALNGAHAIVIGRSAVIGKPVAMLLQQENATVTMCHSKTKNLAALCREADIIIAAAGRAKMVTAEFVREGQVIIDVGINTDDAGKLCGDVDFDAVTPIVNAITPVPGGVGAVTTAILAAHVVKAAQAD